MQIKTVVTVIGLVLLSLSWWIIAYLHSIISKEQNTPYFSYSHVMRDGEGKSGWWLSNSSNKKLHEDGQHVLPIPELELKLLNEETFSFKVAKSNIIPFNMYMSEDKKRRRIPPETKRVDEDIVIAYEKKHTDQIKETKQNLLKTDPKLLDGKEFSFKEGKPGLIPTNMYMSEQIRGRPSKMGNIEQNLIVPPGEKKYKDQFIKNKERLVGKYGERLSVLSDGGSKQGEINVEKGSSNILEVSLSQDDIELAELGMVRTVEDQNIKDEGYRKHAFNTLVSSRMSLHRSVPDTRHEKCKNVRYPSGLPSASIVICFYREDKITLLRMIHSLLDRTPPKILKEIILVDDTVDENYHADISLSVENINSKIHLFKTSKREGLMRARTFGARKSTGDVLVFLDSHVEVNVQWIEPLLSRLQEDSTRVVTPIIDVISADTFRYSSAALVKGGFNWGLNFQWDSISPDYFKNKENFVSPIKSPTMAGGLFAVKRKYFTYLGEYDEGMDIWGGENLELSFRIWMCGGSLEIIPCSRVGHVFRKRRPYGDGRENTQMKNSLRLAHVWMDNYIDKYFEVVPNARNMDYDDISSRVALRKSLGCKSFQWYLENIYPSILKNEYENGGRVYERWDKRKRNYTSMIHIRLSDSSNLCLESEDSVRQKGSRFILAECATLPKQTFYRTDKNELILDKLLCLEAADKVAKLGKCHDLGGNQEWKVARTKGVALYNMASGLCLTALEERSGAYVHMAMCSRNSLNHWDFVNIEDR